MNEKQLLQRLQLLKKNPDIIKPLTNEELAELLLVVLKYIKDVDTGVKQGVIKGDKGDNGKDGKDGKTPRPDKDYLSLKTADKTIKQLFEKAKKEIRDGADGKDAEVTEEQINEAAERAYRMIQLPDFETLITTEPTAIRDALELLQGDERVEMSAVKGLEKRLTDIQSFVSRIPTGSGGGGATKQFVIDLIATEIANTAVDTLNDIGDVNADSPSNGDVPTWDSATEKWVSTAPPGASGGEANTVTNIGSAGVGVYKNKVGVDLKFKNINAGSNKVTITDDTSNDEIDVDIDPSNIATSSLDNDENWADDQTGAEIKTAYENESDTNAYTDSEKTIVGNTSGTNSGDQSMDTLTNVTVATTAPSSPSTGDFWIDIS